MNISIAETSAPTIPVKTPAAPRLHWIDSLRGLAVCAVFLHHLLPHNQDSFNGKHPIYLDLGVFGVVTFFCVSGYVIPYSVLKVKENPAYRFFVTRIFRLYPSYWLSLLLGAAILGSGSWQLLVNASMLQRFFGVTDVVGAYWTLQVEILFYLAIEVLLITHKIRSKKLYPALAIFFALASIAAAAVRYYMGKKAPTAPPIGLTVMFAATTYYMHVSYSFMSKLKMQLFVALTALLISVAFILGYSRDWGYQETPHRFFAMYPLGCVCFVSFAKFGIDNWPLRFMGKISYPVYLIHVPVIGLVFQVMGTQASIQLRSAVSVSITIAGAALIHKFIEEPGIQMGRRILSTTRPAAEVIAHPHAG